MWLLTLSNLDMQFAQSFSEIPVSVEFSCINRHSVSALDRKYTKT